MRVVALHHKHTLGVACSCVSRSGEPILVSAVGFLFQSARRSCRPKILEVLDESELSRCYDILTCSESLSLRAPLRFFSKPSSIIKVCAREDAFCSILCHMTGVGGGVFLWIGIGRNILDGGFQFVEHEVIDAVGLGLRNVC